MDYNKLTLAFNGNTEKVFLQRYFIDSIKQFRIAFIVVTFLYAVFGFLDYLMLNEFLKTILIIRYSVVSLLIFVLLFSFSNAFFKYWQLLVQLSFTIGGIGIGLMVLLEPNTHAYYGGMMLVFMAGFFFVKLRFLNATLSGWLIIIIFNILATYFNNVSFIGIINYNFFFISANIIGMFASYNIELYARRNFYLNQQLDEEKNRIVDNNKQLEKLVELRTIELRNAKETAEQHSANIEAIIDGSQNNIWAFNRNYEIIYLNKNFQNEFQNTFGILLEPGVSLINSLPEPIKPIWLSRYNKVLNNERFTVEDAIDTTNGTIYIRVSFNPIINKGIVIGATCFGSDITQDKNTEMELIRAKDAAEESDRLKSAFLANMSHEIRTPMNGILGFSELLKQPDLTTDEQIGYINIIEKSGARLLSIINDIVDISKIEAGSMSVHIQKTDISIIFDYIYTFFMPEAEAKGLKISKNLQLAPKNFIINTDKEKVYAILTNLVKNAINYSSKGTIELGYSINEHHVIFSVKDEGIGIPSNRLNVIFERFMQADIANKMARQGTGLGLSISKAYVEMLGGKIWVESEVNIGSTFYFTLPI